MFLTNCTNFNLVSEVSSANRQWEVLTASNVVGIDTQCMIRFNLRTIYIAVPKSDPIHCHSLAM